MREGKISPNWTNIVQHRSQSGAPDNTDLKDTWFTPYLDEYLSEIPSHELIVAPDNNNNTVTSSPYVPHAQESLSRKGYPVSEVIESKYSKGAQTTSNLKKVSLSQKSSYLPCGMPSREG